MGAWTACSHLSVSTCGEENSNAPLGGALRVVGQSEDTVAGPVEAELISRGGSWDGAGRGAFAP